MLLALPHSNETSFINQHHCNPTRVVVIGELPYVTNTDQWLNTQLTTEQLGFQTEETVSCRGAIYAYMEWIPAILCYLKLAEN